MDRRVPTCLLCEEQIAPSDRVMVAGHDGEWETSIAREPSLADRWDLLFAHVKCLPARLGDD